MTPVHTTAQHVRNLEFLENILSTVKDPKDTDKAIIALVDNILSNNRDYWMTPQEARDLGLLDNFETSVKDAEKILGKV